MPVYEYIEEATGQLVEMVGSVADRDRVPGFKRVKVPRRIHFLTGRPDPTSADCAVPKALRELEGTMSHEQIAKGAGFSTKKLKEVWGI